MAGFAYTPEALDLQQRFDTSALASLELQVIVHDALTSDDSAFVQSMDYFFLSTVDKGGSPTVSYKGGAAGFVRVHDKHSLQFPCYDGNGMFYSMGNIAATCKVGMLFIDFETPARLRVQGDASLVYDPRVVGQWPGAQFAVHVQITALITNCPRYIHRMQRVAASRYVPNAVTGAQPIPGWKRIDAIQGVLPQRDQGLVDSVGGSISMGEWEAMVKRGDPLA